MVRVLMADDHATVRQGRIETRMRKFKGVSIGKAENFDQALSRAEAHARDLVIPWRQDDRAQGHW